MRARRTGAVFVLAASATLGLPVGAASAGSVQPPVVKTNWYWAEKAPVVGGNALPTLPDAADAAAN